MPSGLIAHCINCFRLANSTDGEFKRSLPTTVVFILLGWVEYGFFAPFYWLRLWLGIPNRAEPDPAPRDESPE
jgi:hypothetical protein